MATPTRHTHLPYLLVAAALMAVAAAVFPWDGTVASAVRIFSHHVGARYFTQEILDFIRPFGKGEVALLIALTIGVCGRRQRAGQMILALLLVSILVWPIKLTVGRERPNRSNTESFPSGDTATIAALCTPLAVTSPWGALLGVAATGSVAAGRIYDGKHFPSDVLTGAACGVLAGGIAIALLRRRPLRLRRKWFLIAIPAILAIDLIKLPWARALPYALDYLSIWGPLFLFLCFARLWPAWSRLQHRRCRSLPHPAILASLVAILLWIYFPLTVSSTLWDRDEPRFSRATVEMVQSGNYLYPTFNGQLRPDKPILIYWLMSGPVRLFGPSEFSCRMVAPLATAATGLMTAWAATLLAGPAAGLLAFAFLALSPLMTVSGTAATTDALLLMSITAAICSFLLSWRRGFHPVHALLMTLALAAALLTKGPVGLAVPLLVIPVALIALGRGALRPLPYLGWLLGSVLVATGLFLAWGIPANIATNGEYIAKGIGHHVVARSLNPLESHGGKSFLFFFSYLPVIVFAFFPWTLYLPMAFTKTRSPDEASTNIPARRLFLAWALPVILLMSAVATKLPHYILPAFPALAIAAAIGAIRLRQNGPPQRPTGPAAWTGLVLFVIVGAALGLALTLAPWFLPVFGLRVPATGLGLLFLAITLAGTHYFLKGRHNDTVAVLITGMTLVLLSAALFLLPAMEQFKLSPRVADCIETLTPPSVPVATCGYGEPSLNFYLNRGPVEALDESQLAHWAARRGPGILVITRPKLRKYHRLFQRNYLHEVERLRGFNYSQGKWVTVVLVTREQRHD